jgi:hypothetical protein
MSKIKLKFIMELDTDIEVNADELQTYKEIISQGEYIFDKEEFIDNIMSDFNVEKREDIKVSGIESYIVEE